ncbi:MAG: arginase family protein [Acidobacteriota bacterium]
MTRVGLALQPYTARPEADEISIAPELLRPLALEILAEQGLEAADPVCVRLAPEEEAERYGLWERTGLADRHLGQAVASMAREGSFVLGLLGNCISSWGMLAGLQHSGPSDRLLDVGLIWIDAHADFNTPETTLTGWLGGMPVSVAAGRCLESLRLSAGLDPAIPTGNIVVLGSRDVDPAEQVLLEASNVTLVSADDMIGRSTAMRSAVERLAGRVDCTYLHVDVDILDAGEIPGSFFETAGGPTAEEVADVLRDLMRRPTVRALGIASFPTAEHGRATSMASVTTLLHGALRGLAER